jgi:hypothetical protein
MHRNVIQTIYPAAKFQRALLVALKVSIHRRRRVVTNCRTLEETRQCSPSGTDYPPNIAKNNG